MITPPRRHGVPIARYCQEAMGPGFQAIVGCLLGPDGREAKSCNPRDGSSPPTIWTQKERRGRKRSLRLPSDGLLARRSSLVGSREGDAKLSLCAATPPREPASEDPVEIDEGDNRPGQGTLQVPIIKEVPCAF